MGVVALFASCSPDSFEGADPNGIPSLEGVEPVIAVDQDINQVTFSLPADLKGCMPVWIFYTNKGTDDEKVVYSTVNGLKKIFATAGDYECEFKLMNRNGVSDGTKSFSFHIDNTIVNYDKFYSLLCGGQDETKSKEWRIDNDKENHLGCGETGTTGLGWWHAGPNEKAAFGVYDNRLIFAGNDKYTFNPGAAGTMYVNHNMFNILPDAATGSTYASEPADDYCVKVDEQTVDFKFETVGDDIFIVFPEHTAFPYIPNPEAWAAPRFRIESITGSEINLVNDNGGIAWHYILTSGAAAVEFSGFKYDSQYNLWKPIDDNNDFSTHFYYAPGWNKIDDPGFAKNGSEYTFTLPEATSEQWQAQCPIKPTSLPLSTAKTYDFSCVINSSADIKGVTVKLTDVESGDNFVFEERVDVKAYEDVVFYLSDVNNLSADAPCELFFDFGGNPANTTVVVKNIVLKDHANDDGTVLPSTDPEVKPSVEWREADNLLANMPVDITYHYAPGWNKIEDPATTVSDGAYTLTFPEATSERWQNQFTFHNTHVALSSAKTYDYRVILSASQPISGVTVKLTEEDNDNVFITEDRHDITEAYTDQVIELVGLKGEDISNLKVVYDFGGNPAGTEVTVKGMLLQEHKATAEELSWDANAADNLWTASMVPNSFHYAPGWNKIADPTVVVNGRTYKVSLPSATSERWQAQVTTETEISTVASQTYDFQVILTANQDLPQATVKLTMVDNDNIFYTEDRHDLKAYEPCAVRYAGMAGLDIDKIKLVLDFGGNADGTEVEVSDIILRPAAAGAKRYAKKHRK